MTRQEKKEELVGLFAVGAIYIGDLIDECFDFGQQHPHWISVEDELPKGIINNNATRMVLTLSADGYIRLDRYLHFYHKWVNGASEVTHWMPLPSVEQLKDKNL